MGCTGGGCNQPGGGCHKKPRARQEIKMKADEEEEEEDARRVGEEKRERVGMRWGGGEEARVNRGGGGEESSKRWGGGEGCGVNWGDGEGVSTITLHVTEHTVTVRLEARYRPSPSP